MILGRPTNLWYGLAVALVSMVSIIAGQLFPDVDSEVIATIASAVTLFLGAAISLVANGAPTVNVGDTVRVQTPAGEPNKTVVVQ
jgi:hypothetical protein